MEITIVCACGAQVSIRSEDPERAACIAEKWRIEHICPVRHDLSTQLGYDLLSHGKPSPAP